MVNISDMEKKLEEKDKRIEELKAELEETERKFKELNSKLEQKVIDRRVEVKRLILHTNKFIDNLSHDLSTPLTPLLVFLPTIKEKIEDSETSEMIDTCIRNCKYIKRVVKNAQRLANINTTDFYLKKERLRDVVDEVYDKYTTKLKGKNIDFENRVNEDLFVKTERDKLIEVFDHLFSNAVDSMPDGGSLVVDARPYKVKDRPMVKIFVSDTGIGIKEDDLSHIFDAFYKVDESRHELESTGLGLSICKRIVEKHRGKIWANSDGKDEGTTVYFTIPSSEILPTRTF